MVTCKSWCEKVESSLERMIIMVNTTKYEEGIIREIRTLPEEAVPKVARFISLNYGFIKYLTSQLKKPKDLK